MSSSSDEDTDLTKTKKTKPASKKHRLQKFSVKWLAKKDFSEWLKPDEKDVYRAKCIFCESTMHANISMLKRHVKAKKHIYKTALNRIKPTNSSKQENSYKNLNTPKTELHNVHNYENTVIVTNEEGETITTFTIGNPTAEQHVRASDLSTYAPPSSSRKLNNACEERSYVKYLKDNHDEWETFGSHIAWECRSIKSKSLRKELKWKMQEMILEYLKRDNEKRVSKNVGAEMHDEVQ